MTRMAFLMAMVVSGVSIGTADSLAEPTILHDSGQAVPIKPYLEILAPKRTELGTAPPQPSLSVAGFGLPVRSPSLTPGLVAQRPLPALEGKMAAARPLFIVGADQWSLQWLQQNRDHLEAMNAAGMVVAVENEQELAMLRLAAMDLDLIAASGEVLAQELGLRHYPALIAPPGILAQ